MGGGRVWVGRRGRPRISGGKVAGRGMWVSDFRGAAGRGAGREGAGADGREGWGGRVRRFRREGGGGETPGGWLRRADGRRGRRAAWGGDARAARPLRGGDDRGGEEGVWEAFGGGSERLLRCQEMRGGWEDGRAGAAWRVDWRMLGVGGGRLGETAGGCMGPVGGEGCWRVFGGGLVRELGGDMNAQGLYKRKSRLRRRKILYHLDLVSCYGLLGFGW